MKLLSALILSIFTNSSRTTEGDLRSCILHDGSEGTCRSYKECAWAENQLAEQKLSYKNLVLCGFESEDLVICCKNGDFARSFVKRKCENACDLIGPKNNKLRVYFKALQGIPVIAGEYKHMAALGYYESRLDKFMYNCGGSLISHNFIITSASCVDGKYYKPKIVKLGRVTLSENVRFEDEVELNIAIKRIFIHPKYSYNGKLNDIALIELNEPAIETDAIGFACLYSGELNLQKNQSLVALGWGDTIVENRILKMLLQDQPDIISSTECSYKLNETSKRAITIGSNQLCVSSKNVGSITTKLCQFGNGGPVQIDVLDKDYIVGVKSFSMACNKTVNGVFTRIANYLDWIEDIVWQDGGDSEE